MTLPFYPRGTQLVLGRFVSTVLPEIDFETYSEAGFIWDESARKWYAPRGATKKGLLAVGTPYYASHPSTEVLMAAYDLKDGIGPRQWFPGMSPPSDLIAYLLTFDINEPPSYSQPGLIEAHNAAFEIRIILEVLIRKHGWPHLEPSQFRCSAAKARAYGLPGALGNLAYVLGTTEKDPEGNALINTFSVPQNPTKKQPKTRILPTDEPEKFRRFCEYNVGDIVAEGEASAYIPDLPPVLLSYWLADLKINLRGIRCDVYGAAACAAILDQVLDQSDREISVLTGGAVEKPSQLARISGWLAGAYGIVTKSLDEEAIQSLLAQDLPPKARRVLEIRQLAGSASVKKVFAMLRQATPSGDLCDMAIFHGARTGRDNGDGVQPLNMPKAGPDLKWCSLTRLPYSASKPDCPHCGTASCYALSPVTSWSAEAVEFALSLIKTGVLELVRFYFDEIPLLISGCTRGLFIARPGKKLIGVDYSSIEAVVTAALAGEQWRLDAFSRGDDIYLLSACAYTGKSLEWYMANGGKKHPDRQNFGKPMELGCGFGGYAGALFNFGFEGTEQEAKDVALAWRAKSPNIVEMWGGQCRGKPWAPDYYELYGLEGAAISAILNPGREFEYRGIMYVVERDVLLCRLLSGRYLAYHRPRLHDSDRGWPGHYSISFEGWNSNQNNGYPMGWCRMGIYGGQFFENVVQATAFDVMAHGVVNLEKQGYPVVLRVHDEVVTEIDEGDPVRTVEAQTKIMVDLPDWCRGWPIRAEGWDSPKDRYRKD